jgi:O-antigen/teichoic acid export membrane protein
VNKNTQAIRRFLTTGLQSAVAWAFIATALRTGAGVLLLPLMLRQLPQEEIGMWYLFLAVGGLAALLDLGIAPTATRAAGYLWAGAAQLQAFGRNPEPAALGETPNFQGLRDLIATLRRFYLGLGLVIFLVLFFGGGWWIWLKSESLPSAALIRSAYVAWCLNALAQCTGELWPNLLLGLNEVRKSQQITAASLVIYYGLAAAGLILGGGLWALVLANFAMGITVRLLGRMFVLRKLAPGGDGLGRFRWDYLRTLWPNAWRLAAVSVGAYLILQANTLICSAYLSLKATASYGLTLQLISMLSAISGTWVVVKIPLINQWRAQHREDLVIPLFASRVRLALLTYLLGALAVLFIAPRMLEWIGAKTTLITTGQLSFFLIIRLLETQHSIYAGLVLSENENPFLRPALLSGLAIVCLSLLATPRLGIWGMLLAAGLVQAAYNNWWTVRRGIAGLNVDPARYWGLFFGLMPAP